MAKHLLILTFLVNTLVHSTPIGGPIGIEPYYHPIESLYHSQDKYGHYSYGYAAPLSTRSETQSADGVTHGGYSYIDSEGHLQSVQYTADPIHGFRVAASNLPRDDADVAHAKAEHLALFEAIRLQHEQMAAAAAANNLAAVQSLLEQQMPQPVTDLPEVAQARAAHMAALQAAYNGHLSAAVVPQETPEVLQARAEHLAVLEATRARDDALRAQIAVSPIPQNIDANNAVVPVQNVNGHVGQVTNVAALEIPTPYSYGFVGPHMSQAETQSQEGVVRGGYSYIDAHGILQTVHYIADNTGFRVAATNLPVDTNHLQNTAAALETNQLVSGAISSQIGNGDVAQNVGIGTQGIVAAEEANHGLIQSPRALYSTEVVY